MGNCKRKNRNQQLVVTFVEPPILKTKDILELVRDSLTCLVPKTKEAWVGLLNNSSRVSLELSNESTV